MTESTESRAVAPRKLRLFPAETGWKQKVLAFVVVGAVAAGFGIVVVDQARTAVTALGLLILVVTFAGLFEKARIRIGRRPLGATGDAGAGWRGTFYAYLAGLGFIFVALPLLRQFDHVVPGAWNQLTLILMNFTGFAIGLLVLRRFRTQSESEAAAANAAGSAPGLRIAGNGEPDAKMTPDKDGSSLRDLRDMRR